MLFAGWKVRIVKNSDQGLEMLPEAPGRGQHFQGRGHSFSLYRPTLQYCAKVMQTNFDEIPGFSKKFCLKRYFNEISLHFCDTYCFDPRNFLNDNSLC